ncbi:MAG TPA: MFS transporter [Croceibacterium sp.]|nr:MFS transporter [Croceibacterium sp.]
MTETAAGTLSADGGTAPVKPHYDDRPWPALRQAYFAAWVLAIVQMCAMLNNGVMTLMVEPVKRDLGLTDVEMSYLLGFSVVLFYALIGIPAARLADRHNRKWLMTLSVAVWSAATAACGLANTFWQFFAARFGIGAGESISGPLSYSMLADYFPPEKLPRGIAIYNVGLQGGNALSLLLGAFLIHMLAGLPTIDVPLLGVLRDWQLVFMLTGLVGIPVALLVMSVTEPKRRGLSALPAGTKPRGATLRQVLAYLLANRRLYGPMFLGLCFTSIHMMGVGAWMAAFYTRTYGWEPATIGLYSGLVSLGLAGPALFGAVWFNEHLRRRGHADVNLRVMAIGLTAASPIMIAAPLMPSPWLALALFGLGPALMLVAAPSLNTALQIITPNEMRGQMTAVYLFIVLAVSQAIGPTFFALLTQYVFGDEAQLRYAIATSAAILFPATAITYWLGIASYRRRILEMRAEGAPV